MNKLLLVLICSYFLSIFSLLNLAALTVGSTTVCSVQPQVRFPPATNNQMLGFAGFSSGFELTDKTTSCSFNDLFTVEGTTDLEGGLLFLNRDIIFDNISLIVNGGKIVGQKHAVVFPNSDQDFSLLPYGRSWNQRLITTDLTHTQIVRGLDWDNTNQYLSTGSNSSGGSPAEFIVYLFNGLTLTNTFQVPQGTNVNTTRWNPVAEYVTYGASSGGTTISEAVYRLSNGHFTITGSKDFGSQDVNANAWYPAGTYLVLGTNRVDQELIVYKFNLITGALVQFKDTSFPRSGAGADRAVSTDAMSFSPDGKFLAVGTAASGAANTLLIYGFNAGTGILTLQTGVNPGVAVNAVDWSPSGTYIAIGTGSTANSLQIYAYNSAASTLSLVTTGTTVTTGIDSVAWDYSGQYLAAGLNIDGPDILIYQFNGTLNPLVTLEGDFEEFESVRWSKGSDQYLAGGADAGEVAIWGFDTNNHLRFIDTDVVLNSKVNFLTPIEFQGKCKIDGRGNELFVPPGGSIVIRPSSSVIFENVLVSGVRTTGLNLMADTSSITLRNSMFFLSSDCTFSRGSMVVDGDAIITGTSKFIFTTTMPCTINSYAELFIDRGVTFSYAPREAKNNLIVMTDNTSVLYLNGCTLTCPTRTGLQLSTGNLVFDDLVTLSSGARFPAERMSLKSSLNINVRGTANVNLFGIIGLDT